MRHHHPQTPNPESVWGLRDRAATARRGRPQHASGQRGGCDGKTHKRP
jgi:hypothetical protein